MRITSDRLNSQALTLTEAEEQIRLTVKDWLFCKLTYRDMLDKVSKIINTALKSIKIPSLKQAARISLLTFYDTQRRTAERLRLSSRLLLFLALQRLWGYKHSLDKSDNEYTQILPLSRARQIVSDTRFITAEDKVEILNYGNALNMYHERYLRDYVKPTLDQMASEEALDPDAEEYIGKRSTLRNRAEREVRYQYHVNEIETFRKKGVNLVICSSHANCSERCRPWQGRVYSLDGTSGITSDGREFVPLEEATNILTPNGKWYNGLLGFNCRHYLVPYKKGYSFPSVSEETEEREYQIDQHQRMLERHVREWRIREQMAKGVDTDAYLKAKIKVKYWNNAYISFSKKSGRAYYKSRTKVL